MLVAIDLEGADVAQEALALGAHAIAGLAAALAELGAARLASGAGDDIAQLVPAYIALPRGLAKAAADMTWSPDLR